MAPQPLWSRFLLATKDKAKVEIIERGVYDRILQDVGGSAALLGNPGEPASTLVVREEKRARFKSLLAETGVKRVPTGDDLATCCTRCGLWRNDASSIKWKLHAAFVCSDDHPDRDEARATLTDTEYKKLGTARQKLVDEARAQRAQLNSVNGRVPARLGSFGASSTTAPTPAPQRANSAPPSRPPPPQMPRMTMDRFVHREMSCDEVRQIDEDLARFCFAEGLPFHALSSPYLRSALSRINPSWLKHTRLTEWNLRHSMLDDEYDKVSEDVLKKITAAFAVTLLSDGWCGVQKKHVLNLLLAAPEPFFIGNIFTHDDSVDGVYQADAFEPIIKQYSIRALVTDNASVMRKTWRLLRDRIPELWTFGCAPHVFNLHVKEIIELEEFKATVEDCQKIAVYFAHNKQAGGRATLSKYQKQVDGKTGSIEVGVKTRWGSQIECALSILKHKTALTMTVNDRSFAKDKENAKYVRALVTDSNNSYWERLATFLRVMEAMRLALKVLQGDNITLADVYAQWVAVHSAHASLPSNMFTVDSTKDDLLRILSARIDFLIHPLHFVAYAFHPRYACATKLDTTLVTKYAKELAACVEGINVSALDEEMAFYFGKFQTLSTYKPAFDSAPLLDDPVGCFGCARARPAAERRILLTHVLSLPPCLSAPVPLCPRAGAMGQRAPQEEESRAEQAPCHHLFARRVVCWCRAQLV